MGRTNPTYRDRLSALEDEWSDFRRGLRHRHQAHFDRLFEQARAHAHAAGYQHHDQPERALLLSILLAHERRLATLEARPDDRDGETPAGGDEPRDEAPTTASDRGGSATDGSDRTEPTTGADP